jgi:hypothetical protein
MSRGFGAIQRAMLFRLAQHEVRIAEMAAELQHPYRSPDRWSLRSLTWSACYRQVAALQWARAETGKAVAAAGGGAALHAIAVTCTPMPRDLSQVPDDFQSYRPSDSELQRFNPSRAIVGLIKRGLVLRDDFCRVLNLALTVEGFAEARRLGGVPDSATVDLDRVQTNWRAPGDFMLGHTGPMFRDDGADAIRRAARGAVSGL